MKELNDIDPNVLVKNIGDVHASGHKWFLKMREYVKEKQAILIDYECHDSTDQKYKTFDFFDNDTWSSYDSGSDIILSFDEAHGIVVKILKYNCYMMDGARQDLYLTARFKMSSLDDDFMELISYQMDDLAIDEYEARQETLKKKKINSIRQSMVESWK